MHEYKAQVLVCDLMQVVIQQLPEWKGHEWKYAKPGESNWESD